MSQCTPSTTIKKNYKILLKIQTTRSTDSICIFIDCHIELSLQEAERPLEQGQPGSGFSLFIVYIVFVYIFCSMNRARAESRKL
jgi:hypothetical protein